MNEMNEFEPRAPSPQMQPVQPVADYSGYSDRRLRFALAADSITTTFADLARAVIGTWQFAGQLQRALHGELEEDEELEWDLGRGGRTPRLDKTSEDAYERMRLVRRELLMRRVRRQERTG